MRAFMRRVPIFCLAFAVCVTANAKPVPNLQFQDLAGHKQKLNDLRGSVVVISFWATWCTPCRDELPRLSELQSQYSRQGVRFIAISVDEPKDRLKIALYFEKGHITLDSWVGADLDTLDHLSLGNVVPATIVLDKDGEAVGRIKGEARREDVAGYLDWLLGDRKGAAPEAVIKRY